MKRTHNVSILACLVFIVSCNHRSYEVKIRSGVVMQSGDVKKLARQEFFILNNSAVSLWQNVLKLHPGADRLILNSGTVHSVDSNPMVEELSSELEQQKGLYNEATKEYGAIIMKCCDLATKNVSKGIEDNLGEAFQHQLRLISYKYEDIKKGSRQGIQRSDLEEDLATYTSIYEYKKTAYWRAQIETSREMINHIGIISDRVSGPKSRITEIQTKIGLLRIKLVEELISATKMDFKQAFSTNIVSTIMTNLDGDATTKLNKGAYYVFGLSKLGQNYILWDHSIKVDKENKYFELSNDNALNISQQEEGMIKVFNDIFHE